MAGLVILTSPLKIMVPIIKVVGDFCNLRCRYCFYNTTDQLTRHVMSDELLEKFLAEYMELFPGNLFLIWHGGEPLLAGLRCFERILELEVKHLKEGQTIRNAIQTNATLVNDEWAAFFKTHNFKVGVSLDGGQESHDHFRKDQKGEGSFDRVMRGIEILRSHGIEPGIIQTLTHDNVPRIKEDFSFFANVLGVKRWGVNDFLDVDAINQAMLNQSVTNEELTAFLKTYIDLWLAQDDGKIQIREIDNFMSGVLGKRASSCTFNGACTGYFCLEYNGKVYPCDRLSNRAEFLLGDLSSQSLLEILNGPARLKYAENVNSLHPDCAACEWQRACHNGCTANRIGGVRGKYYFCETRKAIFGYFKNKLDEYKRQRKGGEIPCPIVTTQTSQKTARLREPLSDSLTTRPTTCQTRHIGQQWERNGKTSGLTGIISGTMILMGGVTSEINPGLSAEPDTYIEYLALFIKFSKFLRPL